MGMGDNCKTSSDCKQGLKCQYDQNSTESTCVKPLLKIGQGCDSSLEECEPELKCLYNRRNGKDECTQPPLLMGEPCVPGHGLKICEEGLECNTLLHNYIENTTQTNASGICSRRGKAFNLSLLNHNPIQ